MFDVSWSEMLVVGVVALVVIGPKELPGVIRQVGRAVGKLRTMAGDFRTQFDDAMREADLHEVKKTFTDAATSAATSFTEPVSELKNEIHAATAEVSNAVQASEPAPPAVAEAPAVEAPAAEPEAAPAPKKRRKKAEAAGEGA
jgi:sec-independent protein translocase protein TatB